MSDTRSQILHTAEEMARSGGYNGFSFRDIAATIGIKSASVHHHFPTKEDLTLEVAKRYHENFFEALAVASSSEPPPARQLEIYCEIFKKAFESSGRACLCGVLSNEAEQLPESVREVVTSFVQANVDWLELVLRSTFPGDSAREHAELVYCALEGAMGVAALRQDSSWLDRACKSVCNINQPTLS